MPVCNAFSDFSSAGPLIITRAARIRTTPAICIGVGFSPKTKMLIASEMTSPILANTDVRVAPFSLVLVCMVTKPATKKAPPMIPHRIVAGDPPKTMERFGRLNHEINIQIR